MHAQPADAAGSARRTITILVGLTALAASLALATPSQAAAELQSPKIAQAFVGGDNLLVDLDGPPDATVQLTVRSVHVEGGSCDLSGPLDVRRTETRSIRLSADTGMRQVNVSNHFMTAGDYVYATVSYNGYTPPPSPCVILKAGPPVKVRTEYVDATTATISWDPVPGATGYQARLKRRVGDVLSTVDVGAVETATLTDLHAGYVYDAAVAAVPLPGQPASGDDTEVVNLLMPPFNDYRKFTDQQFRDFVGRASTVDEESHWRQELTFGSRSMKAEVDSLVDTPRWGPIQSPVIRVYKAALGRWPDTGGFDYWMKRRRAGTTPRMIATVMTQSSEFRSRYGALDNRSFVKQIYRNVLGRSADRSGLDYWTKRLDVGGISRGELVLQFAESSENVRRTKAAVGAINVTTGMLRRTPTAAELATWAGVDPPARTELILHILGTDEYGARITH